MTGVFRRISVLVFTVAFSFCAAAVFAAQAEPIKIGGLFAESGPAAFIGTPSRLVADMAVKEINQSGGVLGRQIKMIIYDTESDPNKALLLARKLVEQDGVLAIIGPTRTDSGLAVKKYTEEKQIPVIMTVGGDPVIAGGKFGPFAWTFKTPQRTSTAVEKIYAYLQGKGKKNVAILTAKDGFGQDGKNHLEALSRKHGIKIVAAESLDPQGTDFSAEMFKLVVAKPDAVIVWTIGPAGAVATKNYAALPGVKPLLIQCHGQPDPKFIELAGAAAEGVLMPGTKLMAPDALPDTDPQKALLLKFIKSYREKGLEKSFPINTHSGYAYDALALLSAGLKKAGKAERPALKAAIENLKGVVGISGIFNLTPEDHNGLDVNSFLMLEVKGGKFQVAK